MSQEEEQDELAEGRVAAQGGPLSLFGEGEGTGGSLPVRGEVTATPGTCHPLQAQKEQRPPNESRCPLISHCLLGREKQQELSRFFPGTSIISSLLTHHPRAAVG